MPQQEEYIKIYGTFRGWLRYNCVVKARFSGTELYIGEAEKFAVVA